MKNEREMLGLPWQRCGIGKHLSIMSGEIGTLETICFLPHDSSTVEELQKKGDFIIRAANCHHELVEALQAIREMAELPDYVPASQSLGNIAATAKQALKKAGAL